MKVQAGGTFPVRRPSKAGNKGLTGMTGEKVKVKSAFKMADRSRKNPDSFQPASAVH